MWDFIDKTYVLSLQNADEKRKIIHNHLNTLHISYETICFTPLQADTQNDCKDIECGLWDMMQLNATNIISNDIAKNHLVLVAKAYKENHQTVMILEDDAIFDTPIDTHKMARISRWIKSHAFDIFYFGYCPWPIPITFMETRDIVKIVSPYTSHSYVLSRSGMQKILQYVMDESLNIKKMGIHYDKFLASIPDFQKFGIFPMINFQNIDPALYRRSLHKIFGNHVYISFRTVVRFLEYVSVILPFLIVFIVCIIISRCMPDPDQFF